MRRALILALTLALLTRCAEPPVIPDTDLGISLATDARTVVFGAPFELTVERTWDSALEAEAWSDETLAPLVVRQESVSLHAADGRVLERRVFSAHAYEMGDVRVLPPPFTAKRAAEDEERVTSGDALDLFVIPSLDPHAPGAIEFPPGPPDGPLPFGALVAALSSVFAAISLLIAVRRRRVAGDTAAVPEPTSPARPAEPALAGVAELRDRVPGDASSLPDFYDEIAGVLRSYVAARYAWGSEPLTTEELVEAGGAEAPGLRLLLVRCDLVRFACHLPTSDETARVLDDAARFVSETSA